MIKKLHIFILSLALILLAACAPQNAATAPVLPETSAPVLSASPAVTGSAPVIASPATITETANAVISEKADVYMTSDISPAGLQAVYEALGIAPGSGDKVGVKVSTGEPPASNYLRQELIGDFVNGLGGTYLECNTAYGGKRTAAAMHYQVASDHGFEPIVLMDDKGEIQIPVDGGLRLETDTVGEHIGDYNFHIVLSHFKGHQMAGYGGALKQLSIGYASIHGKNLIHTGGKSSNSMYGGKQDEFLEAMADAAKGVVSYIMGLEGGQIIYINVMNNLSIDCDCIANPAQPDIHDIGILASTDPVALDRACLDLIYKADGNEAFVWRVEDKNGAYVIEAAEQLGVGSRAYELIDIDG